MGCRRAKRVSGQAAFEYLLITAFGFFLILPIIIIAFTQSASFSSDVTSAQIQKVGNQIIDGVNAVYYSGAPAKKTLKLYLPEGVTSIAITNSTIQFTVQGSGGAYQYAVFADTNMTGSIATFSGIHRLTITAQEEDVLITDG